VVATGFRPYATTALASTDKPRFNTTRGPRPTQLTYLALPTRLARLARLAVPGILKDTLGPLPRRAPAPPGTCAALYIRACRS
jgi:hypothetical protein